MIIRKSLLFTLVWSVGCAAISAYINLAGAGFSTISVQPRWMIALHIAAALLGAFLCARLVVGSPVALNLAETNFSVRGERASFSATRGAQLLGIIVCLMIQFISVQMPSINSKQPDQTDWPVRMNASAGSLAIYQPQTTNCHRGKNPSLPSIGQTGQTQLLLAQCDSIYTKVGR